MSVAHSSNSFGTQQFELCLGSFLERAQEVIFIQMEWSINLSLLCITKQENSCFLSMTQSNAAHETYSSRASAGLSLLVY